MTSKNFITRYILLKIILGEFKENELIPSENKLAARFKCTRVNVRQVYLKLIEHNILIAAKGKGYFVSHDALNALYLPYTHLNQYKLKYLSAKKELGYIWTYYEVVDHSRNLLGYISTKFNKTLENQKRINNITDLLIAYVLDSNLNWDLIQQRFQTNQKMKIKDNSFEGNLVTTNFYDANHDLNLSIQTVLDVKNNLEFKTNFSIH